MVTRRKVTFEDLNEEQMKLYEALPDSLKPALLDSLPKVVVNRAAKEAKARTLTNYADGLSELIASLSRHQQHILDVANSLNGEGVNASSVNIKELTRRFTAGNFVIAKKRRPRKAAPVG